MSTRASNAKRKGSCLKCGKFGHWSKECPQRRPRTSSGSSASSASNGSKKSSSSNVKFDFRTPQGKKKAEAREIKKAERSKGQSERHSRSSLSDGRKARSLSPGDRRSGQGKQCSKSGGKSSKGKGKVKISEVSSDVEGVINLIILLKSSRGAKGP